MVSRSELGRRIAARGATQSQAAYAVTAVLEEITAALAAGEKVSLVGFGTFEPVTRAPRTARNPRTGETVPVAAATVARFHPGAVLKTAVASGTVPPAHPVGALADEPAPAAAVDAPATPGEQPARSSKAGKSSKAKSSKKGHRGKGAEAKGGKGHHEPGRKKK